MAQLARNLAEDHANMAKVLDVLELQLEPLKAGQAPDMEIVRGVLDYCLGYPVLCHHPREDLMFRKLRAVAGADVVDAVGDLLMEHEELAQLTRDLSAAADNILSVPDQPPDRFIDQAYRFLERYRRHMEKEDADLLPAALETLTPEDWEALDRIASGQPDPLSGQTFDKRFAKLRAEILDPRNATSVTFVEA